MFFSLGSAGEISVSDLGIPSCSALPACDSRFRPGDCDAAKAGTFKCCFGPRRVDLRVRVVAFSVVDLQLGSIKC